MVESHDKLLCVIQALSGLDEALATNIFRRLRHGDSPLAICGQLRSGSHTFAEAQTRYLRLDFLLALMQSTAPLRSLVEAATKVLDSKRSKIILPDKEALKPLRDSIIRLESLSGLLKDTERRTHRGVDIEPGVHQVSRNFNTGPTYFVPSSPWTSISDDDTAISHLVSIFLVHLNPMWRFVEEDLFLQAMRSRRKDSDFCSCLLVNAILASSSVTSSWHLLGGMDYLQFAAVFRT